jgi:hypothetical protein
MWPTNILCFLGSPLVHKTLQAIGLNNAQNFSLCFRFSNKNLQNNKVKVKFALEQATKAQRGWKFYIFTEIKLVSVLRIIIDSPT